MQDIGLVGLGVMGENLALNFERNGFAVAGFDVDARKRDSFARRTSGKKATASASLQSLVQSLHRPRRILVMVPAGAAVDAVLQELRPLLAAGDVVIDGGNSHFADTDRRIGSLKGSGILYVGSGVSGGEQGALLGPALMPGGDEAAWPLIRPMLQAIAAKADDGSACCDWIGPGGSGHFVKMVHNGIEYGDMQVLCEAYWLMRDMLGMQPAAIAEVFADWNHGELESYLVDITARILARTDAQTGRPLVDLILDTAEQKGTGKWASQLALDLGVSAPTVASAVFARTMSAAKSERASASRVLRGPRSAFEGNGRALLARIRRAVLAAKVCCYAQGFQLLRTADRDHAWGLDHARIASLWRAGCIIRAKLLSTIMQAFGRNLELANLLVDPQLASVMSEYQEDLREVVALAARQGCAVPALMSALAYYDGYRSEVLPANLLQAQRDYFGAHGYQRVDAAGKFHTDWSSPGS